EDVWALAVAAPLHRLRARGLDGAHVHAVDLLARDVERSAALGKVGGRRRARDRGAHRVTVVLDDVDYGELPQLRHVEALVNLPLIGRAVAEICEADIVVLAIAVRESETGAERDLRANDAVAAEEPLLDGKHVHRAALAVRIAMRAPGE